MKDLYLASYLYAQNRELLRVEREGYTCWFVFANQSSCAQLAELYWSNRATGKVKAFTDAIRSLKDLIFAQGQGNKDGYATQKITKT